MGSWARHSTCPAAGDGHVLGAAGWFILVESDALNKDSQET